MKWISDTASNARCERFNNLEVPRLLASVLTPPYKLFVTIRSSNYSPASSPGFASVGLEVNRYFSSIAKYESYEEINGYFN